MTRDYLPQGTIDHIDLVSDASVHLEKEKGAITWHAVTRNDEKLSMDIPIEVPRHSYSYRHELVGIYEGLSELVTRHQKIKNIVCHCDNEAGIEKIKCPVRNPGAMTAADMDIILAIQKIVKENSHIAISFKHVKGHANRNKPKHKCSRIEQINIDCDEEAELRVQSGTPPSPYSPLPGAKCMVKVSGSWISARVDKAVHLLPGTIAQERFLADKLKIDDTAMQDIDRETITAARSGHSWNRMARTSKMMNQWMPVGHNKNHHGADNDKCPGCGAPDETFIHLFKCPNEKLRDACRKGIEHIDKAGTALKLPVSIHWLLLKILRLTCNIEGAPTPTEPTLKMIWISQHRIGFNYLLLGWISRSWRRGLKKFGSTDPGGQAAQILTLIWDGLCEPIWNCRNDIKSNTPNPSDFLEMATLNEKLQWFRKYKNEVLPERFRYMAEFTQDEIRRWDRDKRRATIRILEKALKIYKIECKQRVSGQRVVTDFFK